jgi:DNA polymerase delta subunit 2
MVAVEALDGAASVSTRPAAALSDVSSYARFVHSPSATYSPQYASLYFTRLVTLRPRATASARAAWGPAVPGELRYADRVLSAAATPNMDAAVVGVIFRDLPNKPSILAEYSRGHAASLIPSPPARTALPYAESQKDAHAAKVILEDETGRFGLDISDVLPQFAQLVTGVVVAVRGREDRTTGAYKVSAVVTVRPGPQPSLPPAAEVADRFVCIVSGLGLGSSDLPMTNISAELLLEFLRANVGNADDAAFSASVTHLIIAGNCVPPPPEPNTTLNPTDSANSGAAAILAPHLPAAKADQATAAAPIVHVDRFLTAAAAALPVSLMPGEHDPVNFLLPQQPVHRCLLPSSSRNKNLLRVTNPYERAFDGCVILGTSGQNIDDFVRYDTAAAAASAAANAKHARNRVSAAVKARTELLKGEEHSGAPENGADNMETDDQIPENSDKALVDTDPASIALGVMRTMLESGHIAPTAPDTLGSFPFNDTDPFVIGTTPHVFFAGNQPAFGTELWECSTTATSSRDDTDASKDKLLQAKVRLISVPRFDQTGLIVVVNLRTLDCTTLHFSDSMLDE